MVYSGCLNALPAALFADSMQGAECSRFCSVTLAAALCLGQGPERKLKGVSYSRQDEAYKAAGATLGEDKALGQDIVLKVPPGPITLLSIHSISKARTGAMEWLRWVVSSHPVFW